MACRAQGLCALLALCLLLLAVASSASHQACTASEAAAASPAPASAAAGWQRALAADPAGAPAAGPRIFDVSVALDASTPKFNSPDGLGADFRVLEASQAKGDAYTSSLLRLGAHTGEGQLLGAMHAWQRTAPGRLDGSRAPASAGTHIDSPGHFIAEAYAAGAGVDRLDLHALNGG